MSYLNTHSARRIQAWTAVFLLQANMALAVEPVSSAASAQAPATASAEAPQNFVPFQQLLRPSRNPVDAYRGKSVAPPSLANSVRLSSLIREGKLYLSLHDAIDLALENNLDLVISRYNLPIAQMDILRTQAGSYPRGVNTGVISGTPGGAGLSSAFAGGNGGGAGGTSSGAGGAGAGSSGLVQSTLGLSLIHI